MLRRHQESFRAICRDIAAAGGSNTRFVGAHVTPGGGKSGLPMIAAATLAEPLGYNICWVVPRLSLRAQGERDFADPQKRRLFGHTSNVRAAGNDWRPARDNIGYVTTYQAIAQAAQLHQDEFDRHPYILILDECHHVPFNGDSNDEEAAYYRAIAPLVDRAKIVVLMSGTVERHDKRRIAFWPYRDTGDGATPIVEPYAGHPEWKFVRYSRKDALEEKAIVPLHFYAMDGNARWYDPKTDEERDVESMAEADRRDSASVLQVVLSTDYAYQLLDKCVENWQAHRTSVYPKAKMLVVAPNINTAREYSAYLRRCDVSSLIATSDDNNEARTSIEQFKRHAPVLVTVGMAYEGLDVPEITHIACLTNIRSKAWIEQCVCRANRRADDKVNGSIYFPDDARMGEIVSAIKAEQATAVTDNISDGDEERKERNGNGAWMPNVPLSSGVTRARATDLEGDGLNYNETQFIENAMRIAGIQGHTPMQMKQFLVAAGQAIEPNGDAPTPDYDQPITTPSDMEAKLRRSIDRGIKRIAARNGIDPQQRSEIIRGLNGEAKHHFHPGRSRDEATVGELQNVYRWLYEKYGEQL